MISGRKLWIDFWIECALFKFFFFLFFVQLNHFLDILMLVVKDIFGKAKILLLFLIVRVLFVVHCLDWLILKLALLEKLIYDGWLCIKLRFDFSYLMSLLDWFLVDFFV